MSNNVSDLIDRIIRDQIALNSGSSYDLKKLTEFGITLTVNLSNAKNRFVGNPTNPIYPDVILWKPDSPKATTGKTVLVEFIETKNTLASNSVATWQQVAALGIPFNLLVPPDEEENIKKIVSTNHIPVTNIYRYVYNSESKRYSFIKI